MNDLVKNEQGELITTSKIVADVFGKAHRDVTRAIDNMECSDKFRDANFTRSSYTSPQNKVLKCYNITRDGFSFLCMGFTGKKAAEWKEKYIEAFNIMEKGLLNVDSQMIKLAEEGVNLRNLGKEWSKFGHHINKQKKLHDAAVKELISKVQYELDFNS